MADPAAARPQLPQVEPVVRVRVARQRERHGTVRLGTEGQWLRLRRETGSERGVILPGPISVRADRRGWTVRAGNELRPWLERFEWFDLAPADLEDEETLEFDGRAFPGSLRIVKRDFHERGEFDVVNHVALEAYLPGVVARELFSHWHAQTHAAQAVAARSFAASEHAYFADRRHYDLTDTQRSQVYGGAVSSRRAHDAVRATRGQVLGHHGQLVPGYYCACCGGAAATALDAIGDHPFNDVAPLCGRPGTDVCTAAPLFKWTIERPRDDLVRRLRGYGKDRKLEALERLRTIESIDIVARNANGRPTRYSIAGEGLEEGVSGGMLIELSADAFRRAADFSGTGLRGPKKRLWSSNVRVELTRRAVTFTGHGHGHGVGMCQYGAEALARAGDRYESILAWYYPGAELVRAYG